MARKQTVRYFSCDFETTVYEGQEYTEVWASAVVELGSEDVKILHSIDDTLDYLVSLKDNLICYYHNLKFDGQFWLYFLLNKAGYKPAYDEENRTFLENNKMPRHSFKYCISDMGQWYTITLKPDNCHLIELRDSLKLLPFSVKAIGKAFNTKHQKLDMEYEGYRYAGCEITEEEQKYIANDVLVIKEALEIMFSQGHSKLTIGSCCLSEYKTITGKQAYESFFPDLTAMTAPDFTEALTVDEYIRRSYRGGWCYLVKGKENKIYNNGVTADVNSLYPSMMSSESGNRYPVGSPTFWKGNFIPEDATKPNRYFFVRLRTRFKIKDGYLPFIQIKGSYRYKPNEMLETSDYYDARTGKYINRIKDENGNIVPVTAELTLTCTDYALLLEHYELYDTVILDGCWFKSQIGVFDEYIEKYKKQKIESKGALRTLAKLFLNNLYGKMASSTDSSFKVAFVRDDGITGFYAVDANEKKAGYIAVGSAITSYARNFTIRSAQKNYYGADKRGFIYADTDSIHCDLKPDEVKGITVHDKNFCCWKLESCWDEAIFVRQKTYIEHVTHEDLEPIAEPYYNIKCAGMPDRCKHLLDLSIRGASEEGLTDREQEFTSVKRELTDFGYGLKVPSKLMPRTILGGVVLTETDYEMRNGTFIRF